MIVYTEIESVLFECFILFEIFKILAVFDG